MLARIIGSSIFIMLFLSLEFYVFYGLKGHFKDQFKLWMKISYWLSAAAPVAWLFFMGRTASAQPLSNLQLVHHLMIGIWVTLLVTKLVYAGFLFIEDFYRFTHYGGQKLVKLKDAEREVNLQSRRTFMRRLALFAAAVPFASFLYGISRGKYAYTVDKVKIKDPELPEAFHGLRMVQISDVHAGSFDNREAVAKGLQMIQDLEADLIVFTGDLVNNRAHEIVPYIDLFANLTAPLGKFSVLGNHDYGSYVRWPSDAAKEQNLDKLKQYQADMGFKMLNNSALVLEKEGQQICLAGVENWGHGPYPKEGDLAGCFGEENNGLFTILLSHDPTHWRHKVLEHPQKVHLTLSGHTHGMQLGVKIPGFQWSPAKWRYKEWAGLYEELDQRLYVNRGFGFLGFPGRVGMLPEITLFELTKA